MQYKVVLVHQQTTVSGCGGQNRKSTDIDGEIEDACNYWASQGYVLVTAYQQLANSTTVIKNGCGNNQATEDSEVGAILIFAKRS